MTTPHVSAIKALKVSAVIWYVAAVIGLWAFGYYIVGLYGVGVATGDLERWNRVLPDGHGYMPGDWIGNLALGGHLLMAAIVTFGGVLQLVPRIRAKAPWFHRWNGRVFLVTAFGISLSGLFMAFTRGNVAGAYMTMGNVLNAALAMTFAVICWRRALARDIAAHSRWALRTFVQMQAIWLYRVGMMLWFGIHRGPVGHTDTFDGPFDIFLAFAYVLLPLAVLELYMLARDRAGTWGKASMAGLLLVLTIAMSLGIALTIFVMWLPRL
jgi:hypothetical protein